MQSVLPYLHTLSRQEDLNSSLTSLSIRRHKPAPVQRRARPFQETVVFSQNYPFSIYDDILLLPLASEHGLEYLHLFEELVNPCRSNVLVCKLSLKIRNCAQQFFDFVPSPFVQRVIFALDPEFLFENLNFAHKFRNATLVPIRWRKSKSFFCKELLQFVDSAQHLARFALPVLDPPLLALQVQQQPCVSVLQILSPNAVVFLRNPSAPENPNFLSALVQPK
ncbi:hypothetical protein CFRS1_v014369 [Colletotrichum fructicola]|nr:hypothetical protein CFRS1_v014369 [Colletotrichum fructicola]